MNLEPIYERYVSWARSLGIRPASPETYARETRQIPDGYDFFRNHKRQTPKHVERAVMTDWALPAAIVLLLWTALFVADAHAQVFVTAQLTDGSGNVATAGFLHFELQNCGNNFPVIPSGTGTSQNPWTIVKTAFDLKPNQVDGSIAGQVLGNDQILCGNVASTYYQVTAMKDADTPLSPVGGQPYVICSATYSTTDPDAACSNSNDAGEWNPTMQQPSFQPVAPGFVQVYQNPINTQILIQPPGTELDLNGMVVASGPFSDTQLVPGACVQAGANGLLTSVLGAGNVPQPCGSGGGGGAGVPNQTVPFTNQPSATLTTTYTTDALIWACYDANGFAFTPAAVSVAAFPVITFTFIPNASGFCAVNGSGGGSGGTSNGGFGVDANTFPGTDPCLKIQAAIYSVLPAGGGIINATNIPVLSGTPWVCSANPFSTPAQTNPLDFAGLPTAGLLLLPDVGIAGDYPFFVANKWTVRGVGGYGPAPSRTTVQPSNNFLANRVSLSAVGGATGCSATGGQSVTITGTTLPAAGNLIGMVVFCSSNASATAIPTPKNAQTAGIITAASGGVLTLSGVGAAGTFSNTGWIIVPLIAGWGPTQTFGSNVDQLAVTCQAPLAYVGNCVGWMDVSGNESTGLTNFSVLGADYMGIAQFSAQSQNGGPFGPITVNWSAHGNNNTIGIEIGGTGWNAGGGGASGLCSPSNPCNGIPNRGFVGVTLIGSGTGAGDGGIGFDINAQNIGVAHSHGESMKTVALIGDSAVARNVEIDDLTGCTEAPCAVTSVVDISASYQTGAVPAPTQAITLRNILPGYSSTWAVRDFINLAGSSDPVLGHYELGGAGNGATPPMVFTNSQILSCITSAGALDSNGAHCAASTQIPIISQLGGVYYAHGFNNDGATDACAQMNNAMNWAYTKHGVTNSVIIDGTGFNRPSAFACATSPWASGGGTYPASGVLRLGMSALSLSLPWVVPAGWTVQGYGGAGLGSGGATGSLLVPNVGSNTVNANWANDAVSGTVSATAGSVTITGVSSEFSSTNLKHLFLACATLPCTTQAAIVQGVIAAVGSTTSLTLDVPAQASLSGAAYTITPMLIDNSGIIRDVGIDGYSFGTGGANGNGGFFGVYQEAVSNSFLENVSFAHVNALPIDVAGANVSELNRINITSTGLANSAFACVVAPNGINIRNLNCATGLSSVPTLSYGIYAAGQSFTVTNALFQDVNIGVELAVSNTVPTNAVTLSNIASGGGSTAATTLIDLAGVNLGTNTLRFAANLDSLTCGGCTSTVVDHISSYTLTDTTLQRYTLGQSASGCRNLFTDSQTANIPNVVTCNQTTGGKTLVGSLPSAASNPFTQLWVTDSTTVSAEGQTCVGGSSNKALAISNGSVWKCF